MKPINYFIYIFLLSFLSFTSCRQTSGRNKQETLTGSSSLSHAKGFDIDYSDKGYTQITVFNPWSPGAIYETYYLVKDSTTLTPKDGQTITIPIKELMVNSVTYLSFLDLLGLNNQIVGVSSTNYIYSPDIHDRIQRNEIVDLGDDYNLDIERLLLLHPNAVMTSAYNAEDENTKRLRQSGLHIIYNIEWQEETLLGRAEWIKFIAAFFDKDSLANELFMDIETKYLEAKEIVSQADIEKPSALVGQDYRGSWSMPGGKSFNAQLLSDAGIRYHYADNQSRGSLTTTIEEALVYFNNADLWINVQASTLDEMAALDQRYKLFNAYKSGEIYNINKRKNKRGGNDYWELGVARPDLLLKDLIKIAHPALLPDYELTFMEKLQ
ncbi:MAG: ABC transporter substrate-binding protein [Bacteroidales bacterium]|nr:ABC transporter substrate-binding protein [Bacteroidales bacterium]